MNKIKLLLFLLFFVFHSCGYQPIYSDNTYANKQILSISVKNIKNRSGQILKNSLLNQINPERERVITKYNLVVDLSESKEELAFRKDMSATRTDLENTAIYSLIEIKSGEIILKQEIKSKSSFDVVESVYATLVAEKDARQKNLSVLSDSIYTNLVIFFKNKK